MLTIYTLSRRLYDFIASLWGLLGSRGLCNKDSRLGTFDTRFDPSAGAGPWRVGARPDDFQVHQSSYSYRGSWLRVTPRALGKLPSFRKKTDPRCRSKPNRYRYTFIDRRWQLLRFTVQCAERMFACSHGSWHRYSAAPRPSLSLGQLRSI